MLNTLTFAKLYHGLNRSVDFHKYSYCTIYFYYLIYFQALICKQHPKSYQRSFLQCLGAKTFVSVIFNLSECYVTIKCAKNRNFKGCPFIQFLMLVNVPMAKDVR